MKENWKDYLLPGGLAVGMIVFLIGVAVFGAPAYERGMWASLVSSDESVHPVWTTEDVSESPFLNARETNTKPVVPAQSVPVQPVSVPDDRLGKPASTKHTDMCAWNTKLLARINTVQDHSPAKVPEWVRQFTTLTESDGAAYYYALGYVHDNFSRHRPQNRGDNFENAVANYNRAIELDNAAYYHHFLGQTNFFYARNTGQRQYFDTAIGSYKRAATLDPTWPQPPSMQGWACLEKGDYEEAYRLFQQALAIDSEWVCPHCGHGSEAKSGLARLRSLKPELFIEKPAVAGPTEAKTVTPDRIGVPETRNSYQLDKWLNKINVIYRQEGKGSNPENAANLLAKKTDLKESDGAFYYLALGYLHDYMARDAKLFRKTNYTRAMENYAKAIELDDSVAIFHHFRGQVNYFYALYENAPEFYDKALDNYKIAEKHDPTWPMAVDMQGWVAMQKKDYNEAIVQLERALEIDAECLDALKCLIDVCVRMSNDDPKDAEIIKKGLAAIKRLHTLLKEGKTFGNITYVPGWSNQLIQRLKQLETVNEETYPELLTRQERLELICEMIRNKQYAKALERIDALDAGEESIYHYRNDIAYLSWNKELSQKLAACRVVCYYETGDYENALEFVKPLPNPYFQSLQLSHRSLDEYYLRLLVQFERYDELVAWSSQAKNFTSPLPYSGSMFVPNSTSSVQNFCDIYTNFALFKTGQTEKACDMFASRWIYFDAMAWNVALDYYVEIEGVEGVFDQLQEAFFEACYQKALKESAEAFRQPDSGTSRLVKWMTSHTQREMRPVEDYKRIAELLELQNNYREAITFYEKWVYCSPNDELALLALMKCYKQAKENDKAVQTASQLIAIAPNNPNYWLERAWMQNYGRKLTREIRFDVTRAIELLEANNAPKDALQRAYLVRAELTLPEESGWALEDCMKAIELVPPGTKIEDARCKTFLQPDGVSLFDFTMKTMQSVQVFRQKSVVSTATKLLERGCDERLLLGMRAKAYWVLGQHDKAIDDYKVVVMFEPSKNDTLTKPDAYVLLGNCYLATGKLDEAIESYTLALEENPNNRAAYQSRATVYQMKSNQPGLLTEEQRQELRELAQQDQRRSAEIRDQRSE